MTDLGLCVQRRVSTSYPHCADEENIYGDKQQLYHPLEWISYSEVQTLRVLEMVEVVETTLVGHVYAYAPVETQNKEVHVIAYAYTGTKSCLLKYVLQAKLRACAVAIIAQSPYVACIKEECTI